MATSLEGEYIGIDVNDLGGKRGGVLCGGLPCSGGGD